MPQRPSVADWVAARFVAETVTWFAPHRFHDPDGDQPDDSATRATVVELITGTFLPGANQDHSGSRR